MNLFKDLFDDAGSVVTEFGAPADALEGAEVLIASYSYEDYSGYAYVLYRKDGQFFETSGSHCSCYGLEGQWDPEATTPEEVVHRLQKGNYFDHVLTQREQLDLLRYLTA